MALGYRGLADTGCRDDRRKRWAMRHRNEAAVHEPAWSVATDSIVDCYDLAATIRHAVLDEFAYGQELDKATGGADVPFLRHPWP
jgi:hypothetical protein